MRDYFVKRLLLLFPTALLTSIIVFGLMKLVPGDAAFALIYGSPDGPIGSSAEEVEEALAEARARLGLDKPIPLQYLDWLQTVSTGDFGESTTQRRPVLDIIAERLPRTTQLALVILIITALWAVPVGVWAAIQHGKATDQVLRVFSVLGLSVPSVWLGTLFLYVFSRYIGWIPPIAWKGFTEDPVHNLSMLAAPALIVSFSAGAPIMRMTRSQMLEVMREDYIRTAQAKGLPQSMVLVRHALRNAILPVLTQFGGILTVLITGTIVIETIFQIPGVGLSMVQAIVGRDFPVIQGLILISVAVILVINLAIDILYSVVDPRIRFS